MSTATNILNRLTNIPAEAEQSKVLPVMSALVLETSALLTVYLVPHFFVFCAFVGDFVV